MFRRRLLFQTYIPLMITLFFVLFVAVVELLLGVSFIEIAIVLEA